MATTNRWLAFPGEEIDAVFAVYHSLVGGGGPPPRALEPVHDSWVAFRSAYQETMSTQGAEPPSEEVPLRLEIEEWARVAGILEAYPGVVTPATRSTVELALGRIRSDLDELGVEPDAASRPRTLGAGSARECGSWLPKRAGPAGGGGDWTPWRPPQGRSTGVEPLAQEGLAMYDAGEALVRRGVWSGRLDEVLLGIRCLFHLDLLVRDMGLRGGRQRASFDQTLLATSLEVARDREPGAANLIFEGVARLARALDATGHRVLAGEVRDRVCTLPRAWLLCFREEWDGDLDDLWPATAAPRNLLKRLLVRDWPALSPEARVDRVARALVFPFGHQHWLGQRNLARWEEELFSLVAGFRGRRKLPLEFAHAVYVRTWELAEDRAAGELTGRMWGHMAGPHFVERWMDREDQGRDT